jgi:Domain of unknown function (DUF4352)
MEPGLYVTFFTKDEPASRELPPVGPLDNVVLRQHVLLAERRSVQQAQELGVAIDRWLEAELEMQRAVGAEPGGSKRTERRFSARDGVYLRFAVFGDAHERDVVPELGPFAVVVVGPWSIEADGSTLATRGSSTIAAWELAKGAGDETVGLHKPDVAVRTSNTTYHPSITPTAPRERVVAAPARPAPAPPTVPVRPPTAAAPVDAAPPFELPPLQVSSRERASPPVPVITPAPQSAPLFTDRPRRPAEIYSVSPAAPAAEPPATALTADDRAMIDQLDRERRAETLRARISGEERKRLGIDIEEKQQGRTAANVAMRYRPQQANEADAEEEAAPGLEWGPAMWRMRFAIIGVLVIFAAMYAFFVLRTGTSPTLSGTQQVQYVGVAQRFSSDRWDFIVNGVQKVTTAGAARSRGNFYVVRLGVTNKGADTQQLSPGDFTIIDANGAEYGPVGISSGAYQGGDNPGSPYVWPQSFAAGKAVTFSVLFDLDPSLPRGMLLKVSDQPNVRVRLD